MIPVADELAMVRALSALAPKDLLALYKAARRECIRQRLIGIHKKDAR